MRTRNPDLRTALLAGCLAAATITAVGFLGGCAKEEPPPVVYTPPPPPPPPPPPAVRSVADLKAELRIDPRVEMAEDRAPASTAARKAILEFFDTFARGDHQALARMLDERDRRELDAMVKSGDWERATKDIDRIEIYQTGPSAHGDCALALFEVDFDLQPQLWYYSRDDEAFTFKAAPTPPDIRRKLSGVDWIASWHAILDAEYEIALIPDMAVTVPQRVLEDASDPIGTSPGGAPPPDSPDPGTPPGPAPVG